MKFFALLCVVGFAAASSLHQVHEGPLVPNKLNWAPDQEYTFNYEGRLLSGIPQIQSQYAGLGLKCQVKIAVKRSSIQPGSQIFTLKIEQPQYASVAGQLQQDLLKNTEETVSSTQYNWRTAQLPSYTPVSGEAARELQLPVSFVLRQDGQFQHIEVNPQDGDWSLNFKKAVAVLFQTKSIQLDNGVHTNKISNEDESMSYWQTLEAGLDGNCEVDYQIQQLPKGRAQQLSKYFSEQCLQSGGSQKPYLITKTRNLDSCTQRSIYNYYNPGMYRCATASKDASGNCEGQWARTSVTHYYACGQSANQLQIQSILNEGELQQDMFGEKTERFTSGSSQFLKLVGKSQQITVSQVQQGKKLDTLSFVSQIEGKLSHLENSIEINNGIQGSSGYGIMSGSNVNELKQNIKQLIGEIVRSDLTQQSQKRTKNEISMKVIALARSFAKLTQQDIQSIYQGLKGQFQGQDQQTMQTIVFDTVLMGGSVQNIRFVAQMAQQGELSTGQLISFFLNVPRYLEVPQEQLLQEIYQIFHSQKVQQSQLVYNQAVLSFSNLIQRACLSSQRNSSYPVYTSNQQCHHNSQIVVDKWIPFLKFQLQKSVQEYQKTEWRNLHLVALGQMRHTAVLPTLLQYIELNEQVNGEQTSQEQIQAQRLTRMVALYSLAGAGRADRQKTIETLSAILKNQGESKELRIAAFDILMKMNPDMYILQSIAAMTWRESNKEVLNVINSAFFTLAHQKENPIFEVQGSSLRRKVYLLQPLLKKTYGSSSATIITGDRLDILGVYYTYISSWASTSGNSFGIVPSHMYSRLTYMLNRYQYTAVEGGLKLKGMENLIQQLVELLVPSAQKVTKNTIGQQIVGQLTKDWKQVVEKLNIKDRDYNGALGALYLNFFEDTTMFHSFKSQNSEELRQKIQHVFGQDPQTLAQKACGNHQVNLVKMMDVGPSRYIVPSEMGFPIRVDINSIATMMLKGNLEVQCPSGSQILPKIKTDLRALLATQYSGFVKVLCPFTQSYNVLGADEQLNIDLPIQSQIEYSSENQEVKANLVTKKGSQQPFDLVFFHVRPFTVKSQVASVKPYPQEQSFQVISPSGPRSPLHKNFVMNFGESQGLSFDFVVASEKQNAGLSTLMQKFRMYNSNMPEVAGFFFASAAVSKGGYPSLKHHEIYLSANTNQYQTNEIDLSVKVGYATKQMHQEAQYSYTQKASQGEQVGQFDYPQWRQLIKVTTKSSPISQVQSQQHKERAAKLNQAMQGISLQQGRGLVIETIAVLKGSNGRQSQVYKGQTTLVKGQDSQSLKQKWSIQVTNGQNQKVACLNGNVQPATPLSSLNIQSLQSNPIEYRYQNILGLGQNCQQGSIKVEGVAKVSQQQIEFSRQSEEAQQLQKLQQRNASLAQVSQLEKIVRLQASSLDFISADVQLKNMEKTVQSAKMLVTLIKSQWWPYQEYQLNQQQQGQQGSQNLRQKWSVRFDAQANTFQANMTQYDQQMQQQQTKYAFENVNMPYYAQIALPANGISRAQSLKGQAAPFGKHYRCEFNGEVLSTWQKALLPISQLDQCQHVIAADCSYRKSFAVLARSISGNQEYPKEVEIVSGWTSIILRRQPGTNQVTLKVNGTSHVLPGQANQPLYIQDGKKDLIAVVYKTQDGTVEVSTVLERFTQQNYLTVKYQPNGQGARANYVSVYVDSSYRGRVCGICGEINGDQIIDQRGPKGCMFSKPELLIASYRSQCSQSQLPSQLQQELQQEQQSCKTPQTQVSKVLMPFLQKYGGECFRHVHFVLEKPDEICVTRFPQPNCVGQDVSGHGHGGSGLQCQPTGTQQKTVSYACFGKDEQKGQNYKQRALNGETIPELRSYPSELESQQQLPKSCRKVSGF